MITNKYLSKGFTLVEMAVVLVIIGLLIGGLLVPISAQIDLRNYSEERKSMEDINEALLGFAMSNGYLPCPAISSSNGAEDRTGNTCTGNKRLGFLPWATLGLHKLDSWGHIYRYSVTPAYTDSTTKITLSPLTAGDITVRTRDSAGALTALTTGNSPAVAVSMGKNGFLAYGDDGVQVANSSATNTDEVTNGNQSISFVSRTYTENTDMAFGGEFDDLVSWISPGVYVSKMVTSNQLP
jgi:prepilin-type N-terminal cleavage/methylation domain-containing protein